MGSRDPCGKEGPLLCAWSFLSKYPGQAALPDLLESCLLCPLSAWPLSPPLPLPREVAAVEAAGGGGQENSWSLVSPEASSLRLCKCVPRASG